jgi:hypothetical protein
VDELKWRVFELGDVEALKALKWTLDPALHQVIIISMCIATCIAMPVIDTVVSSQDNIFEKPLPSGLGILIQFVFVYNLLYLHKLE